MKDLVYLLQGEEYKKQTDESPEKNDKIEIIMKYFHPIGYKNSSYKSQNIKYKDTLCCDKITDEIDDINTYNDYECIMLQDAKVFRTKVFGIQFLLRNEKNHKLYSVWGVVDDIILDCFENKYIDERQRALRSVAGENKLLTNYLETMSMREILITGNRDIFKKEAIIAHDVSLVNRTKIELLIKRVINMDLYHLRNFMISLLLYNEENELYMKYVSYLLYDIIIINKDNADSGILYDSFPWKIKILLKECIQDSIKYTDEINQKYDLNRLSLEQQVYLFKAPDAVKEKAMMKLKEIKGKGEENGKAKQYLEGLLKIPFQVYREEPILKIVKTINSWFKEIKAHSLLGQIFCLLERKDQYTTIEMAFYCKKIKQEMYDIVLSRLKEKLPELKLKTIWNIHQQITDKKIKKDVKEKMLHELETHLTGENIYKVYDSVFDDSLYKITKEVDNYIQEIENIGPSLETVIQKLDDSIYGHDYAKKQILKVFGQWMTGNQKGYCFGFEGSPGIGKTSLAKKGLTQCLVDVDGTPRPFHFIALGGSSNGSTLEGHGYTYQNSLWGKIADILMESRCMNPIIYIDELDKVSKTEHGREIIGILTHLIDSTQNGGFQDKYFAGIDLDLSNVLFVFSYNNAEEIDPILLDRIHRIKFDNLSLEDKTVIFKNYLIPELNVKMGWDKNTLVISDTIIQYIIETYTNEPGIRKLKELLFDMVGEINIEILKRNITIPVVIAEDNLKDKYLKKYRKIRDKKIHEKCHIGYINGLYANSLGQGGIIPIQCSFFPSNTFMDLKLTGLIGNVMQESMNVAKNLAWNLTGNERKIEIIDEMNQTKNQGIHIHCPEGGIKKDGPSGGCCITLAIYSLLNGRPLKNNIAITGEIDLHGNVTAIGGLEFKIIGGIKSGIVHFLFPEENEEDYLDILEKYKNQGLFHGIEFTTISHINDIIMNKKLFN
jgi:ATP-dependent Lon protease